LYFLCELPEEEFMKLYHFPRAPHARKVNIFLHEKAIIDSWERHMELDGYLAGQDAFCNTAERFANYAVAGVAEEFKAIPALAERGLRRLDIFFSRLNQRLEESEYVAGDSFSMADITGVVAVDMATRSQKTLPGNLVSAKRWYKAMYERDSVSSTYIEG
jgi:glutathione S-transferase